MGEPKKGDIKSKTHPVSAVQRGVHPPINLEVLQSNLVKVLRDVSHIDRLFPRARSANLRKKVPKALAVHLGLNKLPSDFNYGLLVVKVHRPVKFIKRVRKGGKLISVESFRIMPVFRKNLLIPSKQEGLIEVFNIIEKSGGIIELKPTSAKEQFYVLTSAAGFAQNPMV